MVCFVWLVASPILAKAEIKSSIIVEDTWFLEDIQAEKGWEYLSTQTISPESPVIVAVIDTGVDYTHPLFQNALWENTAEAKGEKGIDDDGNGYIDDVYGVNTYADTGEPMDDSVGSIQGHGTHVAGSVLLTAGVTLQENPYKIQIMSLKAGDKYGNFSYQNVAEAIYYAVDNGASVINMSLSNTRYPAVLEEAILYARKSAIIVSSAGNKGVPTSDSGYSEGTDYYPAGNPYVVGVMSYNKYHSLSYFSNWDFKKYFGAEYEIVAPGENIYSCYYYGQYKSSNGTSMASGIVSGCAALLWKKYQSQMKYTPENLTAHMMEYPGDSILYEDSKGLVHDFHKLNLYQLLSGEPEPNIGIGEISATNVSTSEPILNYTLFNRGCDISGVSTKITWQSEDGTTEDVPLEQSLENISSFQQVEKNIPVSLPEMLAKNQWITFTVEIQWESHSKKKTYSYYYGVAPTIIESSIPMQGITVSAPSNIMKQGESIPLLVSYLPENTTEDRTLSFKSSAPDIISVNQKGIVTANSQGMAIITITTKNHITRELTFYVYAIGSDKTEELAPTITTKPAITLTTDLVELSSSVFSWNGKVQKPKVSVKGLERNRDYKVTYLAPKSKKIGCYKIVVEGVGNYKGTVKKSYRICGKKNSAYTQNGLRYKITSKTSASTKTVGTVMLLGSNSKNITKLNVKNTIVLGGKTYKVTAIKSHAFENHKKLKKVILGKNIKKIGAYAFDNNRKLKTIITKSNHLTYVGKHAFRNVSKEAKIPKSSE